MNNYKINFIYNNENNINDIFIKVLKKEIQKYIKMICKKGNYEVPSSCTYLSLQDKEDKN